MASKSWPFYSLPAHPPSFPTVPPPLTTPPPLPPPPGPAPTLAPLPSPPTQAPVAAPELSPAPGKHKHGRHKKHQAAAPAPAVPSPPAPPTVVDSQDSTAPAPSPNLAKVGTWSGVVMGFIFLVAATPFSFQF